MRKKGGDDWRRLERHPISAEYEDMKGQVWEDLKARMRGHGFDRSRPIVLFEGKILDGWQRQRAAVDTGKEPTYRKLPKGKDAREYVDQENDFRRHESEQVVERRIAARRKRAAELEAQGDSLRDIAAKTGTSKTQAKRDLEEHKRMSNSGVPQGTPKDDTSSSDDTSRNGQLEDKTVVCERCRRVNKGRPIPGCGSCEAMRRAASQGRKSNKKKPPAIVGADAEEKLDAFKNPVPLKLHDALFDPWIQDGIDTLATISEQFRKVRLGERMQKKAKRYPFFDPKDFADGCGFVIQYLDHLLDHLKDNRPAGVCPECKGLGCGPCRMSGLVPRNLYAELAK